jgi:hypothetical protein
MGALVSFFLLVALRREWQIPDLCVNRQEGEFS